SFCGTCFQCAPETRPDKRVKEKERTRHHSHGPINSPLLPVNAGNTSRKTKGRLPGGSRPSCKKKNTFYFTPCLLCRLAQGGAAAQVVEAALGGFAVPQVGAAA